MKSYLTAVLAAMLCLPSVLLAQRNHIPEVDVAEAIRRGSMVTSSGMGIRAADETAVIRANAPPADDNNMWHVTAFVMDNCAPCEKWKKDAATSPEILAFIAAPEGVMPWAHYNVYSVSDETQKTRVKAYNIKAFPTIVIQPPRDWSWGDPATVIFKKAYTRNPKTFAKDASESVHAFAKVQGTKGYPKQPRPVISESHGAGQAPAGDSRTAPFAVPGPVDPFHPQTYPAVTVPGGDFGPPLTPPVLTLEQLRLLVPDAPASFYITQLTAKASSPDLVKLAWMAEQEKQPKEPPAPVVPPALSPLTFEQVKEILPGADAALIDEISTLHKPTTKEQVLSLATTLAKKKEAEVAPAPVPEKPAVSSDWLGGTITVILTQVLGSYLPAIAAVVLLLIKILEKIAPFTRTDLDNKLLLGLKTGSIYLPNGGSASMQTKTTVQTDPVPSSTP